MRTAAGDLSEKRSSAAFLMLIFCEEISGKERDRVRIVL